MPNARSSLEVAPAFAETSITMLLLDQLFRKTEPLWFEKYCGRNGAFEAVALCDGRSIRVLGTTVAREGLAFVSQVPVHGRDLPLTFTLRRRSIFSHVRIDKDETIRAAKQLVHRYFCSFTSIAADDLDAVTRYVDNAAPPSAEHKVDEDYRTLSTRVQTSIVSHLVRLHRLAAPAPGIAPLIRHRAEPVRELEDGRIARDVRIHSRIVDGDRPRSYDTRFRVFGDETVELIV
jgi:hypothetical protein